MDKIIKFIFEGCNPKGINLEYNRIEDIDFELYNFFKIEFELINNRMVKAAGRFEHAEDEMLDLNDCCLSITGYRDNIAVYGVYNLLTNEVTAHLEDIG